MVANEILVNNFYFYFGFLGYYFSVRFFAYLKNIQSNQMSNNKMIFEY